jgi:Tol biopolymer transport system component
MSTAPGISGIDLFVTDLATHVVTRLTTNERLDQAAIRWSFDGKSIYYTRRGTAPASVSGLRVNELVRIDVASKVEEVVAAGITVHIVSISSFATMLLLTRDVATTGGMPSRALIEAAVGGGERVLLESDATWARYLHGDARAVVITATSTGGDVARDFSVMDLGSKSRTRIANVTGEANGDAYLGPLPDLARLGGVSVGTLTPAGAGGLTPNWRGRRRLTAGTESRL